MAVDIVIVDYGMGNLASVKNMIHKVGGVAEISNDPEKVAKVDKIILPGVGSFDQGMQQLKKDGLDSAIHELGERGVPVLGICLGMQLLGRRSEEGVEAGLSLVSVDFKRFTFDNNVNLPIPHVGWNQVYVVRDNVLIPKPNEIQRFYFTHSYHALCEDEDDVIATAKYGYTFPVAYRKDNIYGVQFHPEKSHRFGMELMKNFIEI